MSHVAPHSIRILCSQLLVGLLLLAHATVDSLLAQELPQNTCCVLALPRPGDSIWEVSTRHLPDCVLPRCDFEYGVHRFDGRAWGSSDRANLIADAEDASIRTIVYVHGNWMTVCDARARALRVYQALACYSDQPIRFIAFSWPSEQRGRPARDVVSKKPLILATSFYLANFISELPAGTPEGMLGYSFGGAIVCGGLHLLSGGTLEGRTLCTQPVQPLHTRVSLTAPAFDRTDLGDYGRYSRAFESVDRMINLYNSQDPILRRFRFFDLNSEPVAAGFAGLTLSRAGAPLDANEKVRQYDCRAVGRSHLELDYLKCPGFTYSILNVLGK